MRRKKLNALKSVLLWINLTKEIMRKCILNEKDLFFLFQTNNVLHFANPNSSGVKLLVIIGNARISQVKPGII